MTYKNFLKKKEESGRGRMTSNCTASSLFREIKTFMFSSIIHDNLNLHEPLFDSFMSKLLHLSMVKHCNSSIGVAIRWGFRGRIDILDKAIICDVKGKVKSFELHNFQNPLFLI